MDGIDYSSSNISNTHTFTVIGDNIYVTIPIINNQHRDGQRFFLLGITSECGIDIWLQIFIWDDERSKCIIETIVKKCMYIRSYVYS